MYYSFQNGSRRLGDRNDAMVVIPIILITAFCFSYLLMRTDRSIYTTSNAASKTTSSLSTKAAIGSSTVFAVTKPQATKLTQVATVDGGTDEAGTTTGSNSLSAAAADVAPTNSASSIQSTAPSSSQSQVISVPTTSAKSSSVSTSPSTVVNKSTAALTNSSSTLSTTVKTTAINTTKAVSNVVQSATSNVSGALLGAKK